MKSCRIRLKDFHCKITTFFWLLFKKSSGITLYTVLHIRFQQAPNVRVAYQKRISSRAIIDYIHGHHQAIPD